MLSPQTGGACGAPYQILLLFLGLVSATYPTDLESRHLNSLKEDISCLESQEMAQMSPSSDNNQYNSSASLAKPIVVSAQTI